MSGDAYSYEVLRPDARRNAYRSTEELLEAYVALLNPLVLAIVGPPRADAVIFLDKSARPVFWMLKAFWPHIAPERESADGVRIEALPAVRFARIDRLDWRTNRRTPIQEGGMRTVDPPAIDGLRSIFTIRGRHTVDGADILIVDEQSETGDTLLVARRLFEAAFPTSRIRTFAWITSQIDPLTGHRRVTNIPVWYPLEHNWSSEEDETGRGVFNPVPFDPAAPAHSSRFPAESYQFMCVPPIRYVNGQRKNDEKSVQLRAEIRQMERDFVEGRIFPAVLTQRKEILGMPAHEYLRLAASIRAGRR